LRVLEPTTRYGKNVKRITLKLLQRMGLLVLILLFLPSSFSYAQSPAKKIWIRGVEYAAQGKLKEAKVEFEKALEVDPLYGTAKRALKVIEDVAEQKLKSKTAIHIFKGISYDIKEQWDESISELNNAIELNPAYAYAYNARGLTYGKKGQIDQAISDYNKAIEINPRYAEAYSNRGVAFLYKREYEKAWDDVHKAQGLGYQVHPGFLKDLREASGRKK